MAKIELLECSRCGARTSAEEPRTVCPKCAGSLYVRDDLDAIKKTFTRESLAGRPGTMWRYADVLPDAHTDNLSEDYSPLPPTSATSIDNIKDDAIIPTANFHARS